MRVNKFVASALGISRRNADDLISAGRVTVDGEVAKIGQQVLPNERLRLDNEPLSLKPYKYVVLNKPIGYVCSRRAQGAETIFTLLPSGLKHLQSVGRLDKDSSGIILLTNDGDFAQKLTHPRHAKIKSYLVKLDRTLSHEDLDQINRGIELNDGPSRLKTESTNQGRLYRVTMAEGRNRQIRRTFKQLGYKIDQLTRTTFGPYRLNGLKLGQYREVDKRV